MGQLSIIVSPCPAPEMQKWCSIARSVSRKQPNSNQANFGPFPRISQLEPTGNQILEHLTRVIFCRSSLDLRQRRVSVSTQRILVLEGVVDVLEVFERSGATQVARQIWQDSVG